MRHAVPFAVALVALTANARAETIYDQPYLGDRTPSPPVRTLATDVAAADQIFIGRATKITETTSQIRATVEALDALKGPLPGVRTLTWVPATTGIEDGSRLVFFVKKGDAFRTMYIHAPPYGRIRAIAALDGGFDATLATLRALIDPKAARTRLADLLKADVTSGEVQRVQTAARLAIDLDAPESVAALMEVASSASAEYRDAVYTLVKLDRKHVRAALDRLPKTPGQGRTVETDAFAAIAVLGDATTVPVIADFADKRPEYRVSAAFALARIGGPAAKKVIDAWIAEPASATKEHMSTGWRSEDVPRVDLYRRALAAHKP